MPSKQTTSDNFQAEPFDAWFSKSKVVDDRGKPLVVYHGSHESFAQFKSTKGAHLGFHFGDVHTANLRLEDTADGRLDNDDIERARLRSDAFFKDFVAAREALTRKNGEAPMDELHAVIEQGGDVIALLDKYRYQPTQAEADHLQQLEAAYDTSKLPIFKLGVGANIGAYHLSIQRPLRMHDVGHWGGIKAIREHLPWDSDARSLKAIAEEIQERDYDGIVYSNRVESPVFKSDSYIAFRPEQIRSAFLKHELRLLKAPDADARIAAVDKARDFLKTIDNKVSLHA